MCLWCDPKLSFHSHTDHDLHAYCKGDQSSSTTPNCVAATRTSISRVIRSYIKTPGRGGTEMVGEEMKEAKDKEGG